MGRRLRVLAERCKKNPCRRVHEPAEGKIRKCTPNPTYQSQRIKSVEKILYTSAGKESNMPEGEKSAAEILEIFDAIDETDVRLLGFANNTHPSRMILQALPVIPPVARAPFIVEGREQVDHLTKMYIDIIRLNNNVNLHKALPAEERKRKQAEGVSLVDSLVYCVKHLIDNTDGKYCQGPSHPFVSLKQRMQGKDAVIRSLLMGKRVNFSARTVLGPDPSLKFGQIRVPEIMAPYLTVPETVRPDNKERLMGLFRAGKITHFTPYGGGRAGNRIKVTEKLIKNQQIELQFRDKVDRHLQNGDFIPFNRQPTLHRFGFMGYEVVLGKQKTIGLHLSSTTPHNADFDGDEGTLHSAQSWAAIVELASFVNVTQCMMTSAQNKNIIGVVYDALVGSYIMTEVQPDVGRR